MSLGDILGLVPPKILPRVVRKFRLFIPAKTFAYEGNRPVFVQLMTVVHTKKWYKQKHTKKKDFTAMTIRSPSAMGKHIEDTI